MPKGKFDYNEFEDESKKKKKKHKKHKKSKDFKFEKPLTYKKPASESTNPKIVINLNIGTDLAHSMLAMFVSQLTDENNNK